MIRVILWDLDNTLLDFDVAEKEALTTDFKEFGLPEFTEDMLSEYMVINRRRWQALERGEMEKQEVLEGRFREFFGLKGFDTSIAAAFNDRYQELLGETICYRDNSYELVKELKGKYLQCMASNGTKKAQTGKLLNSGFDKLFDLSFISEEIGVEKPAIGFFDVALEEVNKWLLENETKIREEYLGKVKPSEILMVGDSLTSDMRGANNAGLIACWYNPKNITNDLGVSIDHEIKNLNEIYDILNSCK
ncbi:YjjG family noncanonical pyrimidine nucleotidase [Butyrivibrio sp. VCB2006]|uniref:YjjG family noncanonical pyrimidine nucleotidase n=1 Tax=Butyrivibrio sp. VCB2006 TaxID=1280679 RepID=UPI0003FE7911|nr:YjjG family noncanonical pyrimidine nucleotidase [Butyrivibrio sp. VCB2006]